MYNRRSISLSDSESENSESYVNKDSDRERERESPTAASERRAGLPRTIRRKNSKVLTPEVLDLCAKEIEQESLFKKRYEQAALCVYGTNPEQHCGLESAALSSQPDGNIFKMPYLSDPCFTSFGYFRQDRLTSVTIHLQDYNGTSQNSIDGERRTSNCPQAVWTVSKSTHINSEHVERFDKSGNVALRRRANDSTSTNGVMEKGHICYGSAVLFELANSTSEILILL